MLINRISVLASVAAIAGFLYWQVPETHACPVNATPTPTPCSSCCSGSSCTSGRTGTNWTSLNTNQNQWFVGNGHHVNADSKAATWTKSFVGDQAVASSANVASQHLSGAPTKANQQQQITSGAMLQWEANKWPSWTTARTQGNVQQQQSAWSAHPLNLRQSAATLQNTNVGGSGTQVAGDIHQKQHGVTGDPMQQQQISGSSQSQGWINPPFPWRTEIGNTFRQVITFSVDNIFQF